MSLLGDIITIEQLAEAGIDDLKALLTAVENAITQKTTAADTQAAIAAVDEAVDVNEDLKFPPKIVAP